MKAHGGTRPPSLDPRSRADRGEPLSRHQPAGRLAAGVRRAGDRAGAGRRLAHRRRPQRPFPPRLLHPARRSHRADRLRGRAAARRPQLHHPSGDRGPARPADLRHVGLLPHRGAGARTSGRDARRAAAGAAAPLRDALAPYLDTLHPFVRTFFKRDRLVDLRPADLKHYTTREPLSPVQDIWVRINGRLPDDPAIHRCALAYASDVTLLDTSLFAHGRRRSIPISKWRASTMPCGSTVRSGPTTGCSTTRTARPRAGPAATIAVLCSIAPDGSSLRGAGGADPRRLSGEAVARACLRNERSPNLSSNEAIGTSRTPNAQQCIAQDAGSPRIKERLDSTRPGETADEIVIAIIKPFKLTKCVMP